jgi:hypothetical protein
VSGHYRTARARGDETARLERRRLLTLFFVVLGVVLVAAALLAVFTDSPEPPPECQPGTECGGPPGQPGASIAPGASGGAIPAPTVQPGTVGIRAGTPWKSTDHGFEFEYSKLWKVDTADGSRVDLVFQGRADAVLTVASVAASDASAEVYANRWADTVRSDAPDLRVDDREKNEILGPMIGFVDGVGRTYAGTWTSPQAATRPIGVSVISATDGRTTVAVVLVVWDPDRDIASTWMQYAIRSTAELVLKTFRWGPT